jgi:hypothetical protein
MQILVIVPIYHTAIAPTSMLSNTPIAATCPFVLENLLAPGAAAPVLPATTTARQMRVMSVMMKLERTGNMMHSHVELAGGI